MCFYFGTLKIEYNVEETLVVFIYLTDFSLDFNNTLECFVGALAQED
jgi:hypothetical protein